MPTSRLDISTTFLVHAEFAYTTYRSLKQEEAGALNNAPASGVEPPAEVQNYVWLWENKLINFLKYELL